MRSSATRSRRRTVSSKSRAMPSSSCRPREVLAQLGQQPGQLLLLPRGRGGQLFGQVAAQGPQCGGEGREGQAVGADLDAAAERDDGPLAGGRGGELLDEPGLPDAGLTAEQQRLRLAGGGAGERVVQYVQFVGPADEHRTDGPGLHSAEHRTGIRHGGTGYSAPARDFGPAHGLGPARNLGPAHGLGPVRGGGRARGPGGPALDQEGGHRGPAPLRAADPRTTALPRPGAHAARANRGLR